MEEPPGKRKRLDLMGEWVASLEETQEAPAKPKEKNDDDEEFYGAPEEKDERAITTYSFEVSDSLLNIGPCGVATIGEPAFLSEEFEATSAKENSPDLELVLTSGHGKNGALTIMQRAIRPQVSFFRILSLYHSDDDYAGRSITHMHTLTLSY